LGSKGNSLSAFSSELGQKEERIGLDALFFL
jgi:hypothetical protein